MIEPRRARNPLVVMAGLPRGGSTTLYHHLQQHPEIAAPFRKETFYFTFNYHLGEDWYYGLFEEAAPGQHLLDVSPDYFYDSAAIARICDFDAQAKIILSVREPVSWILSLYNQRMGIDPVQIPFSEFVEGYDLHVGEITTRIRFSENLYRRMIEMYQETFGPRVLLYDFSLFKRDPLTVLESIERFLDISAHFSKSSFENVVFNASNRRHSRTLYALLNNERTIATLHRLFPDRFLRFARTQYYRRAMRQRAADPANRHDENNFALAKELFQADKQWVTELFSTHAIQLGSGRPP